MWLWLPALPTGVVPAAVQVKLPAGVLVPLPGSVISESVWPAVAVRLLGQDTLGSALLTVILTPIVAVPDTTEPPL